jgi:hypothetical protein
MKKFIYLLFIAVITVISCNKPAEIPLEQDVILKITPATNGLKTTAICDNPIAHYAEITLDGSTFPVEVFYLNGEIYTKTLKLSPSNHSLSMFVLKNDAGTPGDTSDDIEVYATPSSTADYASFVNKPLPFNFSVDAFKKNEIDIQVLCFKAAEIGRFGFSWFEIRRLIVREIAFFGDFCTKNYLDYAGSLYESQSNGLRHDMPAIFEIKVKRNNNLIATYNNSAWKGEGQTLKVQYPDYIGIVDNFEFELSILVKVGSSFQYKKFHTWTTVDGGTLPNIGSDNVMDFVLGSCVPTADLVLPPYMNLPLNGMLTTGPSAWGSKGTFIDVTLSSIPSGFDIQNGSYGAYCAALFAYIQFNATYPVNIYSSLYPNLIPSAFQVQANVMDKINWLGNNLYRYPGYTAQDLQNAIWRLVHPLFNISAYPKAVQMVSDANAFGDGYLPPVGGNAAVLFIRTNYSGTVLPFWQMLFTLVDP